MRRRASTLPLHTRMREDKRGLFGLLHPQGYPSNLDMTQERPPATQLPRQKQTLHTVLFEVGIRHVEELKASH